MLKRVLSRAVLTRSFFFPRPAATIGSRYVPASFPQRHSRFFATAVGVDTDQDPSDLKYYFLAKKFSDEAEKKWINNDMEGALAAYQEAVTIFGSSCNYYSLGSCLQALGKIEEAVEAWKACVDIDFTYNAAHANLAHAYAFVLKKPELALNHYDIALFMNPEDGQTLFHCGVFFESMGKLQAATKMYEDAVANGIDHAQKKLESVRERLSAK